MFKKIILATLVAFGFSLPAFAGVEVVSRDPVYMSTDHYTTQRVCTNRSSGNDVLTGALLGGIIGNNIGDSKGKGAAGAVIGGLLGASKQSCHNERRYSHTTRSLTGWNITFDVDGKLETVYVPN